MVLSHSIDGFTASTPIEALSDDRNALLAVGMNGSPLPPEHGFPARLVVPGLYGFVSATKWVTELEVTRFDEKTAYWTDRGWDAKAPILVASRIENAQTFGKSPSRRHHSRGHSLGTEERRQKSRREARRRWMDLGGISPRR